MKKQFAKIFSFIFVFSLVALLVGCKGKQIKVTLEINNETKVIEVKKGEYISDLEEPTKEGYFFDYWQNTETNEKFDVKREKIEKALTLKAMWAKKLTVTFKLDEETVYESSIVKENTPVGQPALPSKHGYTFDYWQDEDTEERWHFSNEVKADLVLVAVWIKDYVVTFDSNGGNPIESIYVKAGKTFNAPLAPTKIGFIFDYWYDQETGERWDFKNDTVEKDLVLVAKWTDQAVITYKPENGEQYQSTKLLVGQMIPKPIEPTKEGFVFAYWIEEKTNQIWFFERNIVVENVTLVAIWIADAEDIVNVTFDFKDDKDPVTLPFIKGSKLNRPKSPNKEGYYLSGWLYGESNKTWVFVNDTVEEDITIFASWNRDYDEVVVYFDTDGGTPVTRARAEAGTIISPRETTKEGYEFLGWFLDGELFDFATTPVTKNMTVVARWEKIEGTEPIPTVTP